jgi:hypothetical protein
VLAAAGSGGRAVKAELGVVPTWLVVAAAPLGLVLEGYRFVLDDSGVAHVRKNHGDPVVEASRGQIAVTDDDLFRLRELLALPDRVVIGGVDKERLPTLLFVAAGVDGSTLIVEQVRRRRRELVLKTMWKRPAAVDDAWLLRLADPNVRNDGGHQLTIVAPPVVASPGVQPRRQSGQPTEL